MLLRQLVDNIVLQLFVKGSACEGIADLFILLPTLHDTFLAKKQNKDDRTIIWDMHWIDLTEKTFSILIPRLTLPKNCYRKYLHFQSVSRPAKFQRLKTVA